MCLCDPDSDIPSGVNISTQAAVDNMYGTFKVERDPNNPWDLTCAVWSYALKDGSDPIFDNLGDGQSLVREFEIRTSSEEVDTYLDGINQKVKITVNGTSDFTEGTTGALTEDAFDPDDNTMRLDKVEDRIEIDGAEVPNIFRPISILGTYGVLEIKDAAGNREYTPDHDPDAAGPAGARDRATQDLKVGQME